MKHIDFWVCKFFLRQLLHYSWCQNFRRVLNIVFFLLGDSAVSELYVLTFRNILSHLHRRFKREGSLHHIWRWNSQCSETSAHKIQTQGTTKRKNTTSPLFVHAKVWIKIGKMDMSKSSICWINYSSPAPNLVHVQRLSVDKRHAYSGKIPVDRYPHYQCRFDGFVNPNLVTLSR
jgi:hypothetical protein